MTPLLIRPAQTDDAVDLWGLLEPVIRAGETYALDRQMSRQEALAYWLGADKQTFVAEMSGEIVGTYYLRANQVGGGRHVANCGFMTAQPAAGRGVARQMALNSFERARTHGFRAMQFNFVVSSNTRAVGLWQSLGFDVVGRLPGAFEHPLLGEVDALVMFRRL